MLTVGEHQRELGLSPMCKSHKRVKSSLALLAVREGFLEEGDWEEEVQVEKPERITEADPEEEVEEPVIEKTSKSRCLCPGKGVSTTPEPA